MTSRTVKRYADAARPDDLFIGQWQARTSVAWKLWEEIVPLGYQGSSQRVRAYLRQERTSPRLVTARPPSPWTVAGWILRRPEALSETEHFQLKKVRATCPEIDALIGHVRSFATMVTERQGERLPEWLDAVRQDDLPSLHTLAAGIDRDRDAVIAGLTLPGTRASSKAMSTASRCSSARCSAVQASNSSANASYCRDAESRLHTT
jgi:transposase